ncbi:MAG: hypothetical protein ABIR47_07045 [Candidatus Kapaibacterium sp.]
MRFQIWSIDTVIMLPDRSVIEIGSLKMGTGLGSITRDTLNSVRYWNNPRITIDSLHKLFPAIIFIGFEKRKKHADNGVGSQRDNTVAQADIPAEHRGLMLMALCGAIVVPALAYGLRRS